MTDISIKNMDFFALNDFADVLRGEIIDAVAENGGHLASNLGTVELTLALEKSFDFPKDKIIWDVGHQTYTYKMIHGRREAMSKLRQFDGISGFPKRAESEFDMFDSGHSGTSISAAYGLAVARDLKGEKYSCIAVIGDGSLESGVAFEALSDAGSSKTPFIVVLNDNEMSINQSIGGIAKHLRKIRTSDKYLNFKQNFKLKHDPSSKLYKRMKHLRDAVKYAFLPGTVFEELGFKYFGPIDGHNIEEMCNQFEKAKSLERPVLLHVITKKGKGFTPAEENPAKFHGIGPFDSSTVDSIEHPDENSWSSCVGKYLTELAAEDPKIVAITAAMKDGTGLYQFEKAFPNRTFDVGIAEQHAVSFAEGLALNGLKPFVALYSTFLQRAYDQILTETCLMNLPIVFIVDRAGVTGSDGETHQGIYDIEFLSSMPNITILSPRDRIELKKMMKYALTANSPVAIRIPKGFAPENILQKEKTGLVSDLSNKSFDSENESEIWTNYQPVPEVLREGTSGVILAEGATIGPALEISEILAKEKIELEIIDIKAIKPINQKYLDEWQKRWNNFVIFENGDVYNGFGAHISSIISQKRVKIVGWPDKFIKNGTLEILKEKNGLSTDFLAKSIADFIHNS